MGVACSRGSPPIGRDAGVLGDSGVVGVDVDGGFLLLVGVDGGLLMGAGFAPRPLLFGGDALLLDGGVVVFEVAAEDSKLELDGKVGRFVLRLPSRLIDYRVRFFDGAQRVLPSDDQEVPLPDGGLEYHVTLKDPLKPGREYALTIDAQVSAVIADAQGRFFKDRTVELRIAGPAEPEPLPKKKSKRRRSK